MKSKKLKFLQDTCDEYPFCQWCGKEIYEEVVYVGYTMSNYGIECTEVLFLCNDCKHLDWKNIQKEPKNCKNWIEEE